MYLVIDGSFLVYRSRFVLEKEKVVAVKTQHNIPIDQPLPPDIVVPPLTVYEIVAHFFLQLFSCIEEFPPDRIYVLLDSGRSEYRLSLFPDYKANRNHLNEVNDPNYQAFVGSKYFLRTELPKFGIVTIMEDGVEADDFAFLIGKLYATKQGVFFTEDKDWYISINEYWSVYHPRSKKHVTLEGLIVLTGCHENPQMTYLTAKAICGDVSDNIPGVYGVGWKTVFPFAKSLITCAQLGSSKRAQKIHDGMDVIRRNIGLMCPLWILQDSYARQSLRDAELETNLPVSGQLAWSIFCNQFPETLREKLSCNDMRMHECIQRLKRDSIS